MDRSLDLNNAISRLIQALDKIPSNIVKANSQTNDISLRRAGKFAVSYGIGRVGQSAYGLQEASGFDAPNWQKSAMNIGQGALAGAAFGPVGAGIGAGLGIIQSVLDDWAASLKKSVEELDEWNRSVKEASQYMKARQDYRGNREFDNAVSYQKRTGDTSQLLGLRSELTSRASELRKALAEQDRNAASGSVASNAMDMLNDLKNTENKIKSINDILERIEKADKADLEKREALAKADAEKAAREQEKTAREQENLAKARKQFSASEFIDQLAGQKDIKGLSTAALGYKIQMDNATSLEDYNTARSNYAAASSARKSLEDSLIGSVVSEYRSRIEAAKNAGAYDASINNFSSDYRAGLGIGEVGFDVSQVKEDKLIDLNTVIKDTLKEMQTDQKTLIEVTRNLKDLGLLG